MLLSALGAEKGGCIDMGFGVDRSGWACTAGVTQPPPAIGFLLLFLELLQVTNLALAFEPLISACGWADCNFFVIFFRVDPVTTCRRSTNQNGK